MAGGSGEERGGSELDDRERVQKEVPLRYLIKLNHSKPVFFITPTMSQPRKIYVGGWARFREECGATKKEDFEDFSWMGTRILDTNQVFSLGKKEDYEDCREALARVEGCKEHLKAYKEVEDGLNFNDSMFRQIQLHHNHSGASASCLLWSYKALLNDWDGWVLGQKEYYAYIAYEQVQVSPQVIGMLVRNGEYLSGQELTPEKRVEVKEKIMQSAASHGFNTSQPFPVTVENIVEIARQIYDEYVVRHTKIRKQQEEQEFRDAVRDLEFKYKHPFRWFDTEYGSSIGIQKVTQIPPRVMEEMIGRHPDYPTHIEFLRDVMPQAKLPRGVARHTAEAQAFLQRILRNIGYYTAGDTKFLEKVLS